jgi:hypothetical protein
MALRHSFWRALGIYLSPPSIQDRLTGNQIFGLGSEISSFVAWQVTIEIFSRFDRLNPIRDSVPASDVFEGTPWTQ